MRTHARERSIVATLSYTKLQEYSSYTKLHELKERLHIYSYITCCS